MKTKKVNRYYCDFCKKAGCQSATMKRHEKHCTANPQRACRFCGTAKQPIAETLAAVGMVPQPVSMRGQIPDEDWVSVSNETVASIRTMCNNCPACMLAVMRQGDLFPTPEQFDYKDSVRVWWLCHPRSPIGPEMVYEF